MKVNLFETHDRLLEFQKQSELISQGVQDCINNVPDTIHTPFYVFGHSRAIGTDERMSIFLQGGFRSISDVPSARMIWMPYPRKPKAQLNSYLFKATKGTDIVEIIWILPPREIWPQFAPDKMTHNESVWISINNFEHNKEALEAPEKGDLTIDQVDEFREKIKQAAIERRKNSKIVSIQDYKKM